MYVCNNFGLGHQFTSSNGLPVLDFDEIDRSL